MNYEDLVAQRNALDQEIERLFAQEKETAISHVCAQVQKYGLTADECGFLPLPKTTMTPIQAMKKTRTKARVKFRNPVQPTLKWSGRGRMPNWVKASLADGHSIDDLRVKEEE